MTRDEFYLFWGKMRCAVGNVLTLLPYIFNKHVLMKNIVVYVFLLFVHVFLKLSMYSYCCLCILILRPCILIVVYVYLLLSTYS